MHVFLDLFFKKGIKVLFLSLFDLPTCFLRREKENVNWMGGWVGRIEEMIEEKWRSEYTV